MLSPVVLGVKESLARQWGWDRNSVTWKDIAARAQSGQLKYGMTNPAASNSGFTALIGVTAALSGRGDAITTADVSAPAIQGFLKGQALTAGSSGFLGDAYIREQDRLGGLINYESVLLGLNAGGNLREKLTLIYPREGIVTADYPALLMTGAKREAYTRLVDTLRSPEIQAKLTRETLRRPVTPGVKPDPRIPEALLVELPFPGQLDVLNAILTAYLDENRRPLNATFVLDVSGSMDGERLDALKTSLGNLAGGDTSLTGKFSRFSDREQVNLITFSSRVEDQRTFTLGSGQSADATRDDIRAYVNRLSPGGAQGAVHRPARRLRGRAPAAGGATRPQLQHRRHDRRRGERGPGLRRLPPLLRGPARRHETRAGLSDPVRGRRLAGNEGPGRPDRRAHLRRA